MKTAIRLIASCVIVVSSMLVDGDHAAAGPLSEYFVSSASEIAVIQGSGVDRAWARIEGNSALPIVVRDTVFSFSTNPGGTGAEYTQGGVPTGNTNTNTTAGTQFLDGATDGAFNYSVDIASGDVVRFDPDWTNPSTLFTLSGAWAGITFDRVTDTLWISSWTAGTVANYTLGGALLSSFLTGHNQNTALALDPLDGTLWLHDRGSLGDSQGLRFEQWTTAGVMLDSIRYAGLINTNLHGGEFAIPEPSSFLLSAVCAMALLVQHRRVR